MEDYIGKRFGKLVVITNPTAVTNGNRKEWYVKCKCDCGNIKDIRLYSLTKGDTRSCGCLRLDVAKKFYIGKKFGNLLVLDYYDTKVFKSGNTKYRWKCKCDCGNETIKYGNQLSRGLATNCGCKRKEAMSDAFKTHGESKCRLYKIWIGIKERCYNDNAEEYKNYGARGISVCDEWLHDYSIFKKWAEDNGYRDDLTIERINVNGDYCPKNCKWITKAEQANNTRRSVMIEYNGEIHNIAQWSKLTGIKYKIIRDRLFRLGWPIDKALTIPNGAKRGEWKSEKKV